jgi:type IV pilus assembly protein PilA
MNNKKGFTLIELLVVIAIIGVLSTVILTSLSQSQAKAYDAKIKQQLNGFRTGAQMYFTNHTGYGPATNSCSQGMFNDVDVQDGSPGVSIAAGNLPDFSQVTCDSTDTAYAVKATLYSRTDYWCVDNTGATRSVSGTPTSGTICP